jgi:CheY-like chemotaxis protein
LAKDGPDNHRLITFLLKKAGGRRGTGAGIRCRGGPVDVILMDMQTPQLGGYDATESLRGEVGADRSRH